MKGNMTGNRILAMVLAFSLLLTGVPAQHYAAETPSSQANDISAETLPAQAGQEAGDAGGSSSTEGGGNSADTNNVTWYEVKFALPAESDENDREITVLPETLMVPAGTRITSLTTPEKMGYIFLDWYYDDGLTEMAGIEDLVDRNMTLYPKFAMQGESEGNFTPNYVSEREVAPDQEIVVVSYGLSAAEAESLLKVRDITEGGAEYGFTLEELPAVQKETAPEEVDLSAFGLEEEALAELQEAVEQKKAGFIQGTELEDIARKHLPDNEYAVSEIMRTYAPETVDEKVEAKAKEADAGTDADAEADGKALPEERVLTEDELKTLAELEAEFRLLVKEQGFTDEELREEAWLTALGLPEDDSLERFFLEDLELSLNMTLRLEEMLGLYEEEPVETGRFAVRPEAGTWTPGDLHQVEILNTSKLRFLKNDEITDPSVVYYNFDVSKEDINNLKLNDNVVYIPAAETEGLEAAGGLVSLVTDADGNSEVKTMEQTGSFTYTGELALEPGMIAAVYTGTLLENGTVDGGITYVKITEDLGSSVYSYVRPDFTEVVFLPKNIPVPDDGSFEDGIVVFSAEQLDFSGTLYSDLGLDGNTVIRTGDFLTFYTGNLTDGTDAALVDYALVKEVRREGDQLTVTYEPATTQMMEASAEMFLHTEDMEIPTSPEEEALLLDELSRQMVSSGFAEEVASGLGSLLRGEELDLSDSEYARALKEMKFTTDDGRELSLEEVQQLAGSAKNIKVSDLIPAISINSNLKHFEGKKGKRLEAGLSFTVDVELAQADDQASSLNLKASVLFEQEIIYNMKASAKLKWGWKWIGLLPLYLPKDCNIDLTVEVGTYTGAGFICTISTSSEALKGDNEDWDEFVKESEDKLSKEKAKNLIKIGETIKGIAADDGESKVKKIAMAAKDFWKNHNAIPTPDGMKAKPKDPPQTSVDDYNGTGGGVEDENAVADISGTLPDKYARMLNNGSYVPLYSQNLFTIEVSPDPLHLIALAFKADFVVSLRVSAMLGFGVSYGNAKAITFHIELFRAKASTSTADVETPNFLADFYAMGMIGLRAGVRLRAEVGLISTVIDSVGIAAELGMYTEFYGFFYAFYSWKSGEGSSKGVMGSLLFETGVYLTISLNAQLLNGVLGGGVSLVDKAFPILKFGTGETAVGFSPVDPELLELEVPEGKASVQVPDEIFNISIMDLKTGELSNSNKDTKGRGSANYTFTSRDIEYTQYNEKNFIVETHDLLSENGTPSNNHSFQYLPDSNEIYVQPANPKAEELWGEVTFTYLNGSFGFSTVVMKRTLKVHWKGVPSTAQARYYKESTNGSYRFVEAETLTGCNNAYFMLNVDKIFDRYKGYQLTNVIFPKNDKIEAHLKELRDEQEAAYHKELDEAGSEEEKKAVDKSKYGLLLDKAIDLAMQTHKANLAAIWNRIKNGKDKTADQQNTELMTFYVDSDCPIIEFYYSKPPHQATWILKGPDKTTKVKESVKYGEELLANMPQGIRDQVALLTEYDVEWTWDVLTEKPKKDAKTPGETERVTETVTLTSEDTMPDTDTTLTGTTVPHEYKVTWMLDESELIKTEMVGYGLGLTPPEKVEENGKKIKDKGFREGMDFKAWMVVDGEKETEFTGKYRMPNHDITVRASWTPHKHTVTWKVGDEAVRIDTLEYGAPLDPPKPVKENCALSHWTYKKDGKDILWPVGNPMPDQDLVLTAVWEELETSKVTWMDRETVIKTTEAAYGNKLISPGRARRGYILEKWQVFDTATLEAARKEYNDDKKKNSSDTEKDDSLTDAEKELKQRKEEQELETNVYNRAYIGDLTDSFTMPNDDIVIRTKWTPALYTVTWQAGEETIATDVMLYGAQVSPKSESRVGLSLSPWKVNGTTVGDAFYMPDRNITAVAGWNTRTHTVTWMDAEEEKVLRRTRVDYNSVVREPDVPEKTGFTLTGWKIGKMALYDGYLMPDMDITATAVWEANEYKVTWKSRGNTVLTQYVPYGGLLTEPILDDVTGYSMTGWMINGELLGVDFTMPDHDVTITASWTPNRYPVTWRIDGETYFKETVEYGAGLNPPTAEKTGFTLSSWKIDGKKLKSSYTMPAGEVKADASWSLSDYTVNWEVSGVTEKTESAAYGSSLAAPELAREHYTLTQWTLDGQALPEDYTMPAKDITVKAAWKINSHTITWKDGDTVLKTEEWQYGRELPDPPEVEEDDSHILEGWTIDGVDITEETQMPDQDIVIEAVWEALLFNAVWYLDDEAYEEDVILRTDKDIKAGDKLPAAPDPGTREGYTFNGWTVDDELITDEFTMPEDDIEIIGSWTVHTNTVTWYANADDAEPLQTDEGVEFGDELPEEPEIPEKEGYTFQNWTIDGEEIPDDWTMPDEAVTIVAGWEINTHNVTWYADAEDREEELEIRTDAAEYGAALPEAPAAPEKTGYTFAGWTLDGAPIPEGYTMPDKDVEIVGTWSVNRYTLTWKTDEDTVVREDQVEYGAGLPDAPEVSREGYTLARWLIGDETFPVDWTMPDENVEILAEWTINSYALTWKLNDDTLRVDILEYGEALPEGPVKEVPAEDSISEWADEDGKALPASMPAKNLTAKAEWTSGYTVEHYVQKFIQVYIYHPDTNEVLEKLETAEDAAAYLNEQEGLQLTSEDLTKYLMKCNDTEADTEDTFSAWTYYVKEQTTEGTGLVGSKAEASPIATPESHTDPETPEAVTIESGGTAVVKYYYPIMEGKISFSLNMEDPVENDWYDSWDEPISGTEVTYSGLAGMAVSLPWVEIAYTVEASQNSRVLYERTNFWSTDPDETDPENGISADNGFLSIGEEEITYYSIVMPRTEYLLKWVLMPEETIIGEPEWLEAGTEIFEPAEVAALEEAPPEGMELKKTADGGEVPAAMPEGALTVRLEWVLKTYTITWQQDDGSPIDTTTVSHGTVPSHEDAVKASEGQTAYRFEGWDPAPAAATEDSVHTYKAVYTSLTIPWISSDPEQGEYLVVEDDYMLNRVDTVGAAVEEEGFMTAFIGEYGEESYQEIEGYFTCVNEGDAAIRLEEHVNETLTVSVRFIPDDSEHFAEVVKDVQIKVMPKLMFVIKWYDEGTLLRTDELEDGADSSELRNMTPPDDKVEPKGEGWSYEWKVIPYSGAETLYSIESYCDEYGNLWTGVDGYITIRTEWIQAVSPIPEQGSVFMTENGMLQTSESEEEQGKAVAAAGYHVEHYKQTFVYRSDYPAKEDLIRYLEKEKDLILKEEDIKEYRDDNNPDYALWTYYVLAKTEEDSGPAGEIIPKKLLSGDDIKGYEEPEKIPEVKITAGGEACVKYYYPLKEKKVTFHLNLKKGMEYSWYWNTSGRQAIESKKDTVKGLYGQKYSMPYVEYRTVTNKKGKTVYAVNVWNEEKDAGSGFDAEDREYQGIIEEKDLTYYAVNKVVETIAPETTAETVEEKETKSAKESAETAKEKAAKSGKESPAAAETSAKETSAEPTTTAAAEPTTTAAAEPTTTAAAEPETTAAEKSEAEAPAETAPEPCKHEWDQGLVTIPATCTEEGERTYTCIKCGETKTETVDVDTGNHTGETEIRDARAATCGTEGYTGDTYCRNCGAKLAAGETIKATGEHSWNEGKVTKTPTCAEPGERTYECSVCGAGRTEEIPEDPKNHTGETEVRGFKEATCGEDGYTGDLYCTECGELLEEGESIPADGNHSWNSGTVTKEATCCEEGEILYTCTECGETAEERIPEDEDHHTGRELVNVSDTYTGDVICPDCKTVLEAGETIETEAETEEETAAESSDDAGTSE